MASMILANIKHRKTRSIVCIVAVGIGISLLLVLTGLCRGMIRESSQRLRDTGANIIVQPKSASGLLALKGSSLPVRYGPELLKINGVDAVCPVLTWTTTIQKVIYVIYGVDLESLEAMGGPPASPPAGRRRAGGLKLAEGERWRRPDQILIDTRIARANNYRIGDSIRLLGSDFEVSGIFESGIGARVYIPLNTLQESLHLNGMCSLFFVRTSLPDPEAIKTTAERIEAALPALKASSLDNYEELVVEEITGLNEFFAAITATALLISFLVILLTMYTTIVERTREIGILRSIGATRPYIISMVVKESVLLCTVGVVAGLLLTMAVRLWLSLAHPLLTMEVSAWWVITAAVLGTGGGLLGALYPAIKAARVDPAEALLYE